MSDKKVTVGILFGGQSAEHDVSLKSAAALYANLDAETFAPRFIFIDREGLWHPVEETAFLAQVFDSQKGYSFLPWLNRETPLLDADIYFPMLHGPNGEDGRIQALLEMAGKPYVGANGSASAMAMDKVVSKELFKGAGLNVGPYLFYRAGDVQAEDYPVIKTEVAGQLGYPVFVKPSSMGSSVGITKVETEAGLKKALDLAFQYDRKVLIEKALEIREIEISVMGNEDIEISRPGELIPHNDFYDYNDKYVDGKTTFHIPAQLEPEMAEALRRVAGDAFKALFLNGMSRVDLFIEKPTGEIYVNEINTIPGFTEISMFPKLWIHQGISFMEMVTRLIQYGFEYYQTHRMSTAVHG